MGIFDPCRAPRRGDRVKASGWPGKGVGGDHVDVEAMLTLGVILALLGVVLLGVSLVIAGHTAVAAQRKSDRIPDEINAF